MTFEHAGPARPSRTRYSSGRASRFRRLKPLAIEVPRGRDEQSRRRRLRATEWKPSGRQRPNEHGAKMRGRDDCDRRADPSNVAIGQRNAGRDQKLGLDEQRDRLARS